MCDAALVVKTKKGGLASEVAKKLLVSNGEDKYKKMVTVERWMAYSKKDVEKFTELVAVCKNLKDMHNWSMISNRWNVNMRLQEGALKMFVYQYVADSMFLGVYVESQLGFLDCKFQWNDAEIFVHSIVKGHGNVFEVEVPKSWVSGVKIEVVELAMVLDSWKKRILEETNV